MVSLILHPYEDKLFQPIGGVLPMTLFMDFVITIRIERKNILENLNCIFVSFLVLIIKFAKDYLFIYHNEIELELYYYY